LRFSLCSFVVSQVMENLNENRRACRRCERLQPDVACSSGASLKTIEVLGTPITCCTYASALELITMLAREPRASAVCPANTHILGEARHNLEFATRLDRFDLVLPDGMPIVWSLNVRGPT
jgi:UDP-N-acetyl-D-mannosaminuronic acid transferase (WecB/TagA/CpsF family)